MSAEESGVAGVALLFLKEMFRHAAILLGKKDSIMEIPFKSLTFMVESDRRRPHYIVRSESGKVRVMTVLAISRERYVRTL